jgi:hypothetical protein
MTHVSNQLWSEWIHVSQLYPKITLSLQLKFLFDSTLIGDDLMIMVMITEAYSFKN